MEKELFLPGYHLLIDFWGCQGLSDIDFVKEAIESAANACDATILETKLHAFGEGGGITGVSILAESHISIHTWPEIQFAAIDIFVCGNCDVEKAIEPLKQHFQPEEYTVQRNKRGIKTKNAFRT